MARTCCATYYEANGRRTLPVQAEIQ
ncbi:MAG: hypothetical protein JWP08_2406, partial [Bryobacterales bacterium]|nr:hypothetical protein [Bryobacterales bacterium]